MYRNVASKIALFAFDVTTGLPKTGDAANLTAYVSKDGGTVTVLADTSASEMEATNAKGWYLFDVAQGETDAVDLLFTGKSSTANISVVGRPVPTDPNNFTATSIDSNGRVDVIKLAGTTQTARDIGASVLLSSGAGTGQLDFTAGVVKANATQWLGGTIPAVNVTGVPLVDLKYTLGTISPATAGSVRADAVTGAVGSVTGAVGSVTAAVTVGTINANVITAAAINADAITAAKIADGAIDAATFAAGAINAAAIAADAITDAKVASDVTIASVTGSVGSVTGAVGSVTGAVGSVTGNVGGNVVGSVASVTAAVTVGTINSGAINAAAIADAAIDRATFAADTGLLSARSGTAQAGAAGTITLDASASAVTDFYVGLWIGLTGGTGVGQVRLCTAYNGSTKVATVAPNWATNPDATSTFAAMPAADVRGVQGNVTGSVGSVTGAVGSVTGAVGSVTGAVGSVTGNVGGNVVGSVASVTARVTANTDQLAGQTVTAAAGVTFPTSVASPTNITAGTITTVTNLTNAATAGDLTATMKTSVTTAATAATPTAAAVTGAVGSVTGNVGGNVTGSVGSIATGGIAAASFAAGAIDAAAIATDAFGALELAAGAASEIATAVRTELATELGRVDVAVSTRASQTSVDDLPTNAELATALGTADDAVLAQVALVKAVTDKVDTALVLDGAVYQFTANALELAPTGGSAPTAATIADAVWDEPLSGHAISGSTGEALSAAGTAGDPWLTALPGAYGAGTAGKIVGDNINATVGSRATQTSVDDLPTNAELATALGTADDAVLAAVAALNNLSAVGVRTAVGLASANLDTQLDALPTAAELATALGTADDATLAQIALVKAKTDLIPASPAAVGDVPTAAQNADKLLGRNLAGGSDGTRMVKDALRSLRNKTSIAGGTLTVTEEDDTTPAWTAVVTTAAGDPLTSIDPA